MFDAEAEAQSIYWRAGCDTGEAVSPDLLAQRLLGSGKVREHHGLRRPAVFVEAVGEIWIRPDLPPQRRAFLIAHELAEYFLSRHILPNPEEAADAVAAALLAPAPVVRDALRIHGRHLPSLAEALGVSQSIAALRIGEVTGSPLALVTPRSVHVRGDGWIWPEEHEIRRWARRPPSGVVRVAVTDAPARTVLEAV